MLYLTSKNEFDTEIKDRKTTFLLVNPDKNYLKLFYDKSERFRIFDTNYKLNYFVYNDDHLTEFNIALIRNPACDLVSKIILILNEKLTQTKLILAPVNVFCYDIYDLMHSLSLLYTDSNANKLRIQIHYKNNYLRPKVRKQIENIPINIAKTQKNKYGSMIFFTKLS